ncbi:MAG: exopolyphosphatase [Acidimicrobiales bacterium mtb01]|nr:Ppx/GppA family phosphatase [Actinomycetota bacterium]TEX45828.1 MAG: exopolyphosphatase [Acidimicrobiales bacterium mtb01]
MSPRRVASIDIGTNSTNLLVCDDDGTTLRRIVTVTRLGAGVDRTKRLDDDAVARTLTCLSGYRSVLDELAVDRLRVTATSATRDASNGLAFLDSVATATRSVPELLSGDDEARLSHRGATTGLTVPPGFHLVVDIGGGSTELILGELMGGRPTVVAARSIDVGAVRLTDRHFTADPPRPEELTNAIGDTYDLIDDVIREIPDVVGATHFIGTAGTIVTTAAVEMGQRVFDPAALHGFALERAAVEDVFRTLATEPLADRVHNPGLPRDRADVIVGGLCVLVALMRRFDAPAITVSAHNLMDGVCAELRGAP